MSNLRKQWVKDISEYDLLWLQSCFIFLETLSPVKARVVKAKLLNEIPNDYNPDHLKKINLCDSTNITILGVLHLDPESQLYSKCEIFIESIIEIIKEKNDLDQISAVDIIQRTKMDKSELLKVSNLIQPLGCFIDGRSTDGEGLKIVFLDRDETFEEYYNYKSLELTINKWIKKRELAEKDRLKNIVNLTDNFNAEDIVLKVFDEPDLALIWRNIRSEYGVSKTKFGRRINFVNEPFRKKILFRDIAHAYFLSINGLPKPTVILAGSVIEELLRLYLNHKGIKPKENKFDSYVKSCRGNHIFDRFVSELTNVARIYRNIAHIERERSPKDSISISSAKMVFGMILTISEHFE